MDVGGAAKPVKDRVRSWDVGEYLIADNGLEGGEFTIPLDLNNGMPGLEMQIRHDYSPVNYLFCLEVMEYVYDPIPAIETLSRLVIDNGILLISFCFLYPIHEPKQADYARYTRTGAIKLLEENGFKILDIIPRLMTPSGTTQWRQFIQAEGMHAAKGIEHNELGIIVKAQKI